MNKAQLIEQIKLKKSLLCVGLDTDIDRIPKHLLKVEDPIFEFNKAIIDQTKDLAICYKPNLAFYEAQGSAGLMSLKKTLDYIPSNIFTIADAKRGDIGNTSRQYAKAFFEHFNFNAITVSPYMGSQAIEPYLEYKDKWAVVLARTSNTSSDEIQNFTNSKDQTVYQQSIDLSSKVGSDQNIMFVVGATQTQVIQEIRKQAPNYFFLVPGIGAQGGNLKEVIVKGLNSELGLIINSSRQIIYASNKQDFANAARSQALELVNQMRQYISSW